VRACVCVSLSVEAVPLDQPTAQAYEAALTNFQRKVSADQRSLYVSLKHLLATAFEPATLPAAVAAAVRTSVGGASCGGRCLG